MSQTVLYLLHSTSVVPFYIDLIWTLFITKKAQTEFSVTRDFEILYSNLRCDQSIKQIGYLQLPIFILTHWGQVTHIWVSKLTITGSDNGLSPGRRQAIIWTNAGILLIRILGTNFSEIPGEIHSFAFKKMHLKMSSAKGRLFSLGLNELISKIKLWGFGQGLNQLLQQAFIC